MEAITLDELKSRKQWVCWHYENINGRECKIPKNPHFKANAKSNDSTTWGTYDDALRAKNEYGYDGIGIMFSDGIIGIDVDAVGHGTPNALENPIASEVLDLFSDTYIEKSPSGLGYHILGLCDNFKLPTFVDNGKFKLSQDYYMKNADLDLEIYPSELTNRFFTFTGDSIGIESLNDITDKVNIFLKKYMQKENPLDAIINKARNAKDGDKFIALFDNGDLSEYNNDDSAADLALCSILAFYTNGNKEQVDKLFRKSALYRDKWDRSDYREMTINKSLNKLDAEDNKKSSKKENLCLESLERWMKENDITLKYNVISHQIEVEGLPQCFNQETLIEDMDVILYDTLKKHFICNKQMIHDLLVLVAGKNKYNPVLDLLAKAPEWDGHDRLPELYDIMKINDFDDLSKTLIHKWLLMSLALLENRFDNAFGADGILVIQGPQGIGKTSLVSKLGLSPKYTKIGLYVDTRDKDTIIRATSAWICEMGELETTLKSDMERLKAFITADYDRYRLPYARSDTTIVRHTSFIATCNSDKFLVDETGSRRFWTVPCQERFNLDKLNDFDVVQLWKQIEFELHKYPYSTSFGSPFQLSFRLSFEDREKLSERNTAHEKYLKSQQEIEDILCEAKTNPNEYTYKWITPTTFKNSYSSLEQYSAEQIGRALARFNIEKKDMRLDDTNNVSKGCRYLPVPIKHSYDDSDDESYSKESFPNFDEYD